MQAEKINKKEILRIIEKNYGCEIKIKGNFLKTSREKVWLVSEGIMNLKLKLQINSAGLYFGKLKRNNKIQLSIEGAQLIGKIARKNIVEIDEEQAKRFLEGFDIQVSNIKNCEINNFVILKFGKDIIGCGILREGGKIENLLPKNRRLYLSIKKI